MRYLFSSIKQQAMSYCDLCEKRNIQGEPLWLSAGGHFPATMQKIGAHVEWQFCCLEKAEISDYRSTWNFQGRVPEKRELQKGGVSKLCVGIHLTSLAEGWAETLQSKTQQSLAESNSCKAVSWMEKQEVVQCQETVELSRGSLENSLGLQSRTLKDHTSQVRATPED